MESAKRSIRENLHPSCRDGGPCCSNPCGPVYVHEIEPQPAEIAAMEEELLAEEVAKTGRLRSLGRKIMTTIA